MLNVFRHCYYNSYYYSTLLLLHSFRLSLSLFIQMQFLYNISYFCTFLYNLTFIFIFPITSSGFHQKIITHILESVFITRPHIFLSETHLKFFMEIIVLRFLIGWWSVHLVGGRLIGGCWLVVS